MTMKNNIPPEIVRLAERHQAMPSGAKTKASPFEPSEFLNPSIPEYPMPSRWGSRIRELCDIIAAQPRSNATAGQASSNWVYSHYAALHAYEGTLSLALLERVRSTLSWAQFIAYRTRLQFDKEGGRAFVELARHFGRPSVPAHVLPVFAIYEAEKTAGRRLDNLTHTQLASLGLV